MSERINIQAGTTTIGGAGGDAVPRFIRHRPARRKTGLRTRNYTETTLEVSHGRP
jgi:hypothetical protein